jgi:predicted cupin superfamily sugar epimerase
VDGRAAELVRLLGLEPHPEGGHFVEVFRSPRNVGGLGAGGTRAAMTHICFLLARGERSRWHRLASDEVWHFYEGSPLDLLTIAPSASEVERRRLGPPGQALPVLAVACGTWQAARPTGDYTLAGCTVAPGFEYADFELLAHNPGELGRLRTGGVELEDLL